MEDKGKSRFVISLGLTASAGALRAGEAIGEFMRGKESLGLIDGLLALAVIITLVTGVQSLMERNEK